jgi:hypothetical protein
MDALFDMVEAEMERQDRLHPAGYPASRDGVRLGIAAAQDELAETLLAHLADRCRCPVPDCGHARWLDTRTEAIQTVAVLLRMARSICERETSGRADGQAPTDPLADA